jgi:hypothetical protein
VYRCYASGLCVKEYNRADATAIKRCRVSSLLHGPFKAKKKKKEKKKEKVMWSMRSESLIMAPETVCEKREKRRGR